MFGRWPARQPTAASTAPGLAPGVAEFAAPWTTTSVTMLAKKQLWSSNVWPAHEPVGSLTSVQLRPSSFDRYRPALVAASTGAGVVEGGAGAGALRRLDVGPAPPSAVRRLRARARRRLDGGGVGGVARDLEPQPPRRRPPALPPGAAVGGRGVDPGPRRAAPAE